MARFEFGSLEKDILKTLKTSQSKKEVSDEIDKAVLGNVRFSGDGGLPHTPEEAADKLIEVLKSEIETASIPDNVKDAIRDHIVHDKPYKIGDNEYSIHVYWDVDLSRPSLNPNSEDLRDLAELYNTGVNHEMKQIFGMWHGKRIGSRTVIPGTHFMEIALANFMSAYSDEYGVETITYTREQ